MGECGCSGFAPQFQMPGPNGTIYAIRVYPGCDYCDAPVGIDIDRLDEKAQREWMADGLTPPLKFHPVCEGMENAALPVVHPSILERRLAEYLIGADCSDDVGAEVTAEEFIRECFGNVLSESQRDPIALTPPESPHGR